MKNLIKCDKCGKMERMKPPSEYKNSSYLPDFWKYTDIGELCPICYQEYKEMLDKFINK